MAVVVCSDCGSPPKSPTVKEALTDVGALASPHAAMGSQSSTRLVSLKRGTEQSRVLEDLAPIVACGERLLTWQVVAQDVKWQPLSVRVWGCRVYRLGFIEGVFIVMVFHGECNGGFRV